MTNSPRSNQLLPRRRANSDGLSRLDSQTMLAPKSCRPGLVIDRCELGAAISKDLTRTPPSAFWKRLAKRPETSRST